MHATMRLYLVLFLTQAMNYKDQEGSTWTVGIVEDRHGRLRYNVIRQLQDGTEERKALNEAAVLVRQYSAV